MKINIQTYLCRKVKFFGPRAAKLPDGQALYHVIEALEVIILLLEAWLGAKDDGGEVVVGDKVGDLVGERVVGLAVGFLVGRKVGEAEGTLEGETDGEIVGTTVGLRVGDREGLAVGEAVGEAVGDLVGLAVGTVLGPLLCVGAEVLVANVGLTDGCFVVCTFVGEFVGFTDGFLVEVQSP